MRTRQVTRGRRVRAVQVLLIWATSCIPPAACQASAFAGGTGGPDDPYQIATAEHLLAIGADPNLLSSHFVLVADIDLDPNLAGVFTDAVIAPFSCSGYGVLGYTPALWGGFSPASFNGVFDGNGRVIRNLVIRGTGLYSMGLFGYVGTKGLVKNLGVEAGDVRCGTVNNQPACPGCPTSPPTSGCPCSRGYDEYTSMGILVGYNKGTITACHTKGYVCAQGNLGGLAGRNEGAVVACYSQARVYGQGSLGGLVGHNQGEVVGCYSSHTQVHGEGSVGGLVGFNRGNVATSYSTGAVGGKGAVGGAVGDCQHAGTHLCFWDTQTSGLSASANGKGRTTVQMLSRGTYQGWGYGGLWTIDDGRDYPRLAWENTPGTMIVDPVALYSGGSGEPNDPYQIRTADQLVALGVHPEDFDRHFVVTADIDFNSVDSNAFVPIGYWLVPFSGVLDGQSHVIRGFHYEAEGGEDVGLFGCLGGPNLDPTFWIDLTSFSFRYQGNLSDYTATQWALIQDLHLGDVRVVGGQYVGGLVGCNRGRVVRCSVTGLVRGQTAVGGIAGRVVGGEIQACQVNGEVDANGVAGGLIGVSYCGVTTGCLATGRVTGVDGVGGLMAWDLGAPSVLTDSGSVMDVQGTWAVGGLVGTLHALSATGSVIARCYSRGKVTGGEGVGGLVGQSGLFGDAISDCYSVSPVSGRSYVGGLVGSSYNDLITHCYAAGPTSLSADGPSSGPIGGLIGYRYTDGDVRGSFMGGTAGCFWDQEASGQAQGIGEVFPSTPQEGLTGETTDPMRTAGTFAEAGWDLVTTWSLCEGKDYPRLRWEQAECPQ